MIGKKENSNDQNYVKEVSKIKMNYFNNNKTQATNKQETPTAIQPKILTLADIPK